MPSLCGHIYPNGVACKEINFAGGLCRNHYHRKRRGQDLDEPVSHNQDYEGICKVILPDGVRCFRVVAWGGMCWTHYNRFLKDGDEMDTRIRAYEVPTEKPLCAVEGCLRVSFSKGMCQPHYRKNLKYGDPLYRKPRAEEEDLKVRIDPTRW